MIQTIGEILLTESVTQWGVCRFADIPPLFDCAAKSRIPENAKSVIITLFPYRLSEYEEHNISKYAIVPDYHRVCTEKLSRVCGSLKKLYPDNNFVCFTDNSPIREVPAAVLAGVGVLGRNGLLINKKYGSYVFICEIVTDLDVPPSAPDTDGCLQCGLCEKSCPGHAIKDGRIEREKCLSYITQKKGTLESEEEELIKKSGSVWGCDVCSDVCPMNRNTAATDIKEFCEDTVFKAPYPKNNREVKDRAFGFRGAEVIRRNLSLIGQKGKK